MRGCDHVVHIHFDIGAFTPAPSGLGLPLASPPIVGAAPRTGKRHFIVEFNADGEVLRIKERRNKTPPMVGVYDASWWVASSHPLGGGATLPKRIIAAARSKMEAEDRNADATP